MAPGPTASVGDHPGLIARPSRIAYMFLGIGATLGWLWPLLVLPAWSPAGVRYAGARPAMALSDGAGLE
jgi:hypothetical protein